MMMRPHIERIAEAQWLVRPTGKMRVPCAVFASEKIMATLEPPVFAQIANVACLPGVVAPACVMPDAHQGYGFPIGGVAAFDPDEGGVVSAGGVGLDIACGVRCLTTNLTAQDILAVQKELADALFKRIPAGVGKGGELALTAKEIDAVLRGGASWAVKKGLGEQADLSRIEEGGRMAGAEPENVSDQAKARQRDQVGTLGSGNHYLEIQEVAEIINPWAAEAFGLSQGQALVSIHCGSRGLGHQIGTDYLAEMVAKAPSHGLSPPDRELACAPIKSALGRRYLGAMRAGINCALANRQVLTHLVRQVFAALLPGSLLRLLYDVSHNTCKEEEHTVEGAKRRLHVHRKGATRAFGPAAPGLSPDFRRTGQPVLVGGSMGTASYVLRGLDTSLERSFGSANHGAGRAMSRTQAKKRHKGREVIQSLASEGVLIRAKGYKGVAEEAPAAYKDIHEVVKSVHTAGLAAPVARLAPLICIKG